MVRAEYLAFYYLLFPRSISVLPILARLLNFFFYTFRYSAPTIQVYTNGEPD